MLTKKTPTATEASWQAALARFDDWQLARGMGEKTRRAYGVDLLQLAEWASGRDLEPGDLSHRELRHFAGVVSERGAMKSTVARKLAAIRTFYRYRVSRARRPLQIGHQRHRHGRALLQVRGQYRSAFRQHLEPHGRMGHDGTVHK